MNKPTVDEIILGLEESRDEQMDHPNRYTAVMVTAKRARQINSYYRSLGEGGVFEDVAPPLDDHGFAQLSHHLHGGSRPGRDHVSPAPRGLRARALLLAGGHGSSEMSSTAP